MSNGQEPSEQLPQEEEWKKKLSGTTAAQKAGGTGRLVDTMMNEGQRDVRKTTQTVGVQKEEDEAVSGQTPEEKPVEPPKKKTVLDRLIQEPPEEIQ